MGEPDDSSAAALRAFAVAAIALGGFLFSLSPAATYLDHALLEWEWPLLRKCDPGLAPDDILIVGIDPGTVNSIPEPPALWHASLGRALTRIAAAKPRAIGLDFPLPERSYDAIHAGLDNALFAGLAAAARNGPFVAVLSIDARTRSARRIHPPYLALLGDSRLGIGLRIALAAALLSAIVAFAASLLALRGGLVLPVASIFFTLALAWGARAAGALRPTRGR